MASDTADNVTAEYSYIVVKERLKSEILGEYTAYGIKITRNGKDVDFISDISTDPQKAEQLAKLCEEARLHPIHILDVIEDFLVDLNEDE